MAQARRLIHTPLAVWERDGLKAALVRAGLSADDLGDPYVLAWRFETAEDVPVGFGCLEIYGYDALLRGVVTLPPLRQVGMGAAIVDVLEAEARARRCPAIYLLTTSERISSAGSATHLVRAMMSRRPYARADNLLRSLLRRRR